MLYLNVNPRTGCVASRPLRARARVCEGIGSQIFSDNFGHGNCVILRENSKVPILPLAKQGESEPNHLGVFAIRPARGLSLSR
jgi:hypothetical protein